VANYSQNLSLKSTINKKQTGSALQKSNNLNQSSCIQTQLEEENSSLVAKLKEKDISISKLSESLKQQQESNQLLSADNEQLRTEIKNLKEANNGAFRDQLLAISTCIIKQFGTRQFINSLQLTEEDESSNDSETEQVCIHYSFPQFKMLSHSKVSKFALSNTIYKNG
jgi:hypothetical protein